MACDLFTTLMLHCDTGDSAVFLDSSPSPFTVTPSGGATVDTAVFKFGNASGIFSGTGGYLTAPDNAVWTFGTGNWTIDLQVNFLTVNSNQTLISHLDGNGDQRGWAVTFINTSGLRLVYSVDGINSVALDQAWTPLIDTWYHVALVRSSGTIFQFVDGTTLGAPQSIGTSNIFDSTAELMVAGNNPSSPVSFFWGHLDEIRISSVARWTDNFTAPTGPWCADSGNNITGGISVILQTQGWV